MKQTKEDKLTIVANKAIAAHRAKAATMQARQVYFQAIRQYEDEESIETANVREDVECQKFTNPQYQEFLAAKRHYRKKQESLNAYIRRHFAEDILVDDKP